MISYDYARKVKTIRKQFEQLVRCEGVKLQIQ